MRTPSKYGNKKTQIDGHIFASLKEASRYRELKTLFQAGTIQHLELQPPFDISINGRHIATYLADFRYVDAATNHTIIEDVKGMRTPIYQLKKKLVEALYGIEIIEV